MSGDGCPDGAGRPVVRCPRPVSAGMLFYNESTRGFVTAARSVPEDVLVFMKWRNAQPMPSGITK